MPNNIRNLISQGKIEEAIQELKRKAANNSDLLNQIAVVESRLKKLRQDETKGFISYENARISNNQIVSSILNLLSQFNTNLTDSSSNNSFVAGTNKSSEGFSKTNGKEKAGNNTTWLIGLSIGFIGTVLIIIGFLITLEIYPCNIGNEQNLLNKPAFEANDTTYFKILVTNFRFSNNVGITPDYGTEICQRIDSIKSADNLKIKVHCLNIDSEPKLPREANIIAQNNNADLLIWGSSREKEENNKKSLDELRVRYTMVKRDKSIGKSRMSGDTGFQKISKLDQLRLEGYLQTDVDYIINWVIGINEFSSGNHLNALKFFNKINDNEYFHNEAEALGRIGDIYRQLGNYTKALLFHRESGKSILSMSEVDKNELEINKIYLSLDHYSLGNLDSASYYLNLDSKEELMLNNNFKDYFFYMGNIAIALIKLGRFNEAISIQEDLIFSDSLEQVSLEDLNAFLSNVGTTYLYLNKFSESSIYFNQAKIALLTELGDSIDLRLGIIEGNLGELKRQQCEYSSALAHTKSAKEILKNFLPEDHINLATIHNNLGGIYHELENYSEALNSFSESERIFKKIKGEDNVILGLLRSNTAVCLVKMERHEDALKESNKAIEILENLTQESMHPNMVIAYNSHAHILFKTGKVNQAGETIEKAISIAYANNYSQNLALFLANASNIYRDINVKKSKKYKKMAFFEFSKQYNRSHCIINKLNDLTENI